MREQGPPRRALEQRIAEAITDLLCDPARLERQIDQKIERERQAVMAPEKEIWVLKERLERLALTRRNYQDQQAAGLMTLDELGQRLSELDEGRESMRQELATVQDRNERIEEMENKRTIVLALYAGFISASLNVLPPEERRRVYSALGLRVALSADGNVEIHGNFDNDVFPLEKETNDLVSGIVHDPERQARREALRAAVGTRLAEHRRGVMSAETTPTCSDSCIPPTPP